MNCSICMTPMDSFASAKILGQHQVGYFLCPKCGYVCTEEPFWLEDAYSSAITKSDVGLVRRNMQLSQVAGVLVSTFFDRSGSFVDYAGGYGLFVRLMRDNGFDFRWYDKYCANLFASDFAAPMPGAEPVELLTAFEVFEHLVDPWSELESMLGYSRNILFTTQILPEPTPTLADWWYYGLEHGQHISFYSRRALATLAKRAGLNFYTNGASMHLFTEKRLSQPLFFCLARYRTARLLAPFAGRNSLLEADYKTATGAALTKGR